MEMKVSVHMYPMLPYDCKRQILAEHMRCLEELSL